MPDFTPNTYKLLLSTLLDQNYTFQPFVDFLRNPESRSVILRHDVDAKKMNSLRTAQLENELGIRGTYYFRMVQESFDVEVIKKIAGLGHEVGYHYEDVSLTAERQKTKGKRQKEFAQGAEAQVHEKNPLLGEPVPPKRVARGGLIDRIMIANPIQQEEELCNVAIESFKENLEKLRRVVPIETICMHGSPLSRWDNRLLWKYYEYRDFDIIGEPYFDVDFEKVLYLTDTGRRWDGGAVAIRDKVTRREGRRDEETKRLRDDFHSTFDIINAARGNRLPDQIMLTVHPQRWDDQPLHWVRELMWQNVKNIVKLVVARSLEE